MKIQPKTMILSLSVTIALLGMCDTRIPLVRVGAVKTGGTGSVIESRVNPGYAANADAAISAGRAATADSAPAVASALTNYVVTATNDTLAAAKAYTDTHGSGGSNKRDIMDNVSRTNVMTRWVARHIPDGIELDDQPEILTDGWPWYVIWRYKNSRGDQFVGGIDMEGVESEDDVFGTIALASNYDSGMRITATRYRISHEGETFITSGNISNFYTKTDFFELDPRRISMFFGVPDSYPNNGEYSISLGPWCGAPGDYSMAFGSSSWANGYESIACGSGSYSEHNRAFTWTGFSGYGYSKGPGTFNIYPKGGLSGFYIDGTNLTEYLNMISGMTPAAVKTLIRESKIATSSLTNETGAVFVRLSDTGGTNPEIPIVQSIRVGGVPVVPDENNVVDLDSATGVTEDRAREIADEEASLVAESGTNYTDEVASQVLADARIYTDRHIPTIPTTSVTNRDGKTFTKLETSDCITDPGTTWTRSSDASSEGTWNCFAFGHSKFVGGKSGNGIWTSEDGNVWTNVEPGIQMTSVCFAKNAFIGNGTRSGVSYFIRSSDGMAWETVQEAGGTGQVIYGGGKFISYSGGRIWYSNNGTTWLNGEFSPEKPEEDSVQFMAYGNGIYLAICPEKHTWISEDGILWGRKGGADWILSLTYGNGYFVAGNMDWGANKSEDGLHWQWCLPPADVQDPRHICYSHGRFYAFGRNGGVFQQSAYSDDLKYWTRGPDLDLTSTCVGADRIVATQRSGTGVYVSPIVEAPAVQVIQSVRVNGKLFKPNIHNMVELEVEASGSSGISEREVTPIVLKTIADNIDTNLTEEGKIADAKAVGDRFSDFEHKLSDYETTSHASQTYQPKGDYLYSDSISPWAKAANKPSYSVAEISGAVPETRTVNGLPLTDDIVININTNPLVGIEIDFSTNAGYYRAVELISRALGATLKNPRFVTGE